MLHPRTVSSPELRTVAQNSVSGRRPTLLLADDHPMMLRGLWEVLAPVFDVIGTAMDGRVLLEAVARRRPDLVITDISMPGIDGIEATRRLQTAAPGVRVLILSIHTDPAYVQAAFAAGAWGYLTKTSAPEEIERAVREVLAGRFYVSPEIARAAVLPAARGQESPLPMAAETLTRRERDILRLVAEGLGNQQIARRLGVAVTTVRTHLHSLYGKLRVKNRMELVLYASQARCTAATTLP